jgi:hypothetical protein
VKHTEREVSRIARKEGVIELFTHPLYDYLDER